MGNIKIKGVSYTDERAMALGIHPTKKKKVNSERQAKLKKIRKENELKEKEASKESFQEKASKGMEKK
jgi:hypothetical protein